MASAQEDGKLELELKHLIVDSLNLEDVSAPEINSTGRLFGEGLGLDSIDALELAMAIHRRYGVEIAAEDEDTKDIFQSVRSLAIHIRTETDAPGAMA